MIKLDWNKAQNIVAFRSIVSFVEYLTIKVPWAVHKIAAPIPIITIFWFSISDWQNTQTAARVILKTDLSKCIDKDYLDTRTEKGTTHTLNHPLSK